MLLFSPIEARWIVQVIPLFRLKNDICSCIIHFQKDRENYRFPALLLNLLQMPETIIMVILEKRLTVVQD